LDRTSFGSGYKGKFGKPVLILESNGKDGDIKRTLGFPEGQEKMVAVADNSFSASFRASDNIFRIVGCGPFYLYVVLIDGRT